MKLRFQTTTHLLLTGVPGSIGWMLFALLLGLLFSGVFGVLAWRHFQAEGYSYNGVMCSLGAALGQLFFWTGLVTLAVGRETLELNKSAAPGSCGGCYRSRSPIVRVPKSFDFDLSAIEAVSIERFTERHPGGRRDGGSEMDVCRARLLINKPRRAITLNEPSNYRDARVTAIGQTVAAFLEVSLKESDQRADT